MTGILKLSIAMAVVSGLAGVVGTQDPVQAETLTVAAAHSLKGAFQNIVLMFEEEYGVTVQVVYGSSQTLRRQIKQGAPIDVFLPESFEEVEKLQKKGLTLNGGTSHLRADLSRARHGNGLPGSLDLLSRSVS